MSEPPIAIAPLRHDEVEPAADALACAYLDEPVYRHLLPDTRLALRVLRRFLAVPLRDAIQFRTAHAATAGRDVIGAAAWLPPDAYPWSRLRRLRAGPAMLAVLFRAPRAAVGLMRLGANVERASPHDPTWYLEAIGVHPEVQSRGIGSALMAPGIAWADQARLPCYLETSRRRNVHFYERFGFRVEREGAELLPGGPTHWTMRRPPR